MTDNMQTPLERAARAAIEAECGMRGIDLGSPLWGKEIARAVLHAIREPSEAMIANAWDFDLSPQTIWPRMIDAALGEG